MQSSRRSFTDFVLHLHPPTIHPRTVRFTLSFGLGGMAAVLVCLLFLTGILQLLVYQPSAAQAYASVRSLIREVPLGRWVRNIHHWSANILVVVAVLHLLRVVLTGAFGPGRRLNWIIGLVLLFFVLFANFTGYLLSWDQLAYWAVTICTSMLGYVPLAGERLMELFRGGAQVGQQTLSNFFMLHVAFIPGSLFLLMLWHFWLVRRAGGLVTDEGSQDEPAPRVPAVPDLVVREAAVALILVAFVLVLGILRDAPLLEQANPGMSPNPAKAPWYFLGFQELLMHLHPVFAVFVWPLAGIVALFWLPFCPVAVLRPGVWFGDGRGKKLAGVAAGAGTVVTLAVILADDLLLRAGGAAAVNTVLIRGIVPTVLLAGFLAGAYLVLVRKREFSPAEAVMAGIVFVLVSLAVLTIAGVYFRGVEMDLVWPWRRGGV